MKEYSGTEIIKGIARKKERIIKYVYSTCYPDIRKLILTNAGNEHDAEDIFQEAMLKVFQKITAHGLEIQSLLGGPVPVAPGTEKKKTREQQAGYGGSGHR